MALSQDEQRILAEIERRLANDDPGLASSLTAFRRPGPAKMLRRSPRVRIVGSLFAVLLVAMVSLTVYAMIPFRAHLPRQPRADPGRRVSHTSHLGQPQRQRVQCRPGQCQPGQRQPGQRQRVQRQPGRCQPGQRQSAPPRPHRPASRSRATAKPTSTAILPTANP